MTDDINAWIREQNFSEKQLDQFTLAIDKLSIADLRARAEELDKYPRPPLELPHFLETQIADLEYEVLHLQRLIKMRMWAELRDVWRSASALRHLADEKQARIDAIDELVKAQASRIRDIEAIKNVVGEHETVPTDLKDVTPTGDSQ